MNRVYPVVYLKSEPAVSKFITTIILGRGIYGHMCFSEVRLRFLIATASTTSTLELHDLPNS